MSVRYLIDKSALARMQLASVREKIAPILEAGEAATCAVIDLEILYCARGFDDYEKVRERRALAYHRVPIPDLIIAAAAERAGLVVLHYDHDDDLIAGVTGQPCEWVAPRGSL